MARSRSYSRSHRAQGPALPGLEDAILRPAPASNPRTPAREPPPPAVDAQLVLVLHDRGHLEALPLLALCVVRGSGATWRATQAQAAEELGITVRHLRRLERQLLALGLIEVLGKGPWRHVRVLHKVIHKFSTSAERDVTKRTSVSGSLQAQGTRARAESGIKTALDSSYLTGGVDNCEDEFDQLVLEALLWPNVLPEALSHVTALGAEWGRVELARYLRSLRLHVAGYERERRGALALGALRKRAGELARNLGPRP